MGCSEKKVEFLATRTADRLSKMTVMYLVRHAISDVYILGRCAT